MIVLKDECLRGEIQNRSFETLDSQCRPRSLDPKLQTPSGWALHPPPCRQARWVCLIHQYSFLMICLLFFFKRTPTFEFTSLTRFRFVLFRIIFSMADFQVNMAPKAPKMGASKQLEMTTARNPTQVWGSIWEASGTPGSHGAPGGSWKQLLQYFSAKK